MNKILIFFLASLISCQSKSTNDKQLEILAFKNMSDLTTVEYTLSKVVKVNDNGDWYKLGNRKILMSVTAYVKAGIDFGAIETKHITINKNEVTILLPKAKIISLSIPPNEIKEESKEVSLVRSEFSNDEKNKLLIQAETSINKAIDSLGIVQKAATNATAFITNFVQKLGYSTVIIVYDSTTTK